MTAPELFIGSHYSEMVRIFVNACETYFILTGIADENTKALFAKTHLSDTAHTCYDRQAYNEITVAFATVKSLTLDYLIPFDYIKKARRGLVARKMG